MLAPGRGDQAEEQQGGGEEAGDGDGEHRHQRTNMALIASQQYRQQATPLSFVLSILVVRLGYMAAKCKYLYGLQSWSPFFIQP